ncbi:MAG: S8 family serine peptidase [Candidatus Bipolaricaulia bacterium]
MGRKLLRRGLILAALAQLLLLCLGLAWDCLALSLSLGQDDQGLQLRLYLELPSIGELAGLATSARTRAPLLSLSLSQLLLVVEEALPPSPPPRLTEEEASKLDPLLRLILQREREARERGEALNLARFAPLAEVYTPAGPLLQQQPVPTALGEFLPPPQKLPQAGITMGERLGLLVRARTPDAVARSGAEIITTVGEITVARATLAQLRRLAQSPEVIYIEAAYRLAPSLDKSVPAIGADRLHRGEPPLKGEGVLIGAVDTGVDYEHLDFRFDRDGDGFEESSRLAYIWDQTETGPFGDRSAVPFGTEYKREEIELDLARGLGPDKGAVRQRDEVGHGTHVLGIAAGDGSSSGAGYIGVAPEAELIMVKTSFYTGDVVSGVEYIFRRAEELGRPCVVNLSLGGHFGPHDGTSNFDLAIEGLLGPGRAIVASAGNEGDEPIHISGWLASPGSSAQFTFIPAEETVYLGLWYPGTAAFEVELGAPVGEGLVQIVAAPPGTIIVKETAVGTVSLDNASGGPNPNNGDKEIGILLEEIKPGQPWTIRLIAQSGSGSGRHSGSGRFDGWPGLAEMGAFLQGDSSMTISEPGDAAGLITVGAWTTRVEWRSRNGNDYHFREAGPLGGIAPFSSRGPTRDGRQKPDLAAPGTAIASSLAKGSKLAEIPELIVPDGVHAIFQGTSMAAPHVAGTVALMLQASPLLEPKEAGERLRRTAAAQAQQGGSPSEAWGSGKLDAERSVSLIGLKIPQPSGAPEVKAGTNPASERVLFTYVLPPGAKRARLIVFNVLGQTVFSAELDPKEERFIWDLVDNRGEPLANGLYIYVVIADGRRSALHRLVIRR